MDFYTIIGCWPESTERFAEAFRSVSSRAAEDEMAMRAREMETTFFTAAVVHGDPPIEDTYTAFIDPMDSRNEGGADAFDLYRPAPESTNVEWTVFGIAWSPTDGDRPSPSSERWSRTVMADSAWAAEDVAHSYIAEEDGRLWICGVLKGSWIRADTPRFVNPELQENDG